MAGHDCQAGQGGSGAPMTAKAADLDPSAGARPVEHRSEGDDDWRCTGGNTEIRPVEVVVGPRWLPPMVEVETVVGRTATGVGIVGIERHSHDGCAIGQDDEGTVPMSIHLLRTVIDLGGGCFGGALDLRAPGGPEGLIALRACVG